MKEFVHVYKRFGNEEYVIHTIIQPNNKVANMRWYIRKRPFVGSTKVDILYEGAKDNVSLSQGRKSPEDIWKNKKSVYVVMMDEHIKMRRKKMQEMIANGENIETHKSMRSTRSSELAPMEKFIFNKRVKDAERLEQQVDVLYPQTKMRDGVAKVAKQGDDTVEEVKKVSAVEKPGFKVKDVIE